MEYLEAASHGALLSAARFKPIRTQPTDDDRYGTHRERCVPNPKFYDNKLGVSVERPGLLSARATAANHTLDQGSDIAKVQEWLAHASLSTTRVYDHRETRPEDSPVFKVSY